MPRLVAWTWVLALSSCTGAPADPKPACADLGAELGAAPDVAAAVVQQCGTSLPKGLAEWLGSGKVDTARWARVCGTGASPDGDRVEVFNTCKLERYGISEHDARWGDGDLALGAATAAWLNADDGDLAARVGRAIAGESPIVVPAAGAPQLPTVTEAPDTKLEAGSRITVVGGRIYVDGDDTMALADLDAAPLSHLDPWAGHTVAALAAKRKAGVAALALDRGTSLRDTRRIAASFGTPGKPFYLAAEGPDGLAWIPVVLPDDTAPARTIRLRRNGVSIEDGAKRELVDCDGHAYAACTDGDPEDLRDDLDALASTWPWSDLADGPATLDPPDDLPVQVLATAVSSLGAPVTLAMDWAPCLTPPEGMACVPGGPALVGSNDHAANEAPEREILVSTFYVDIHEVTVGDYQKCIDAGFCPERYDPTKPLLKPFTAANQPVVPMDWPRAYKYCAWAGGRLLSEWEWEKAARGPDGDTYPWGDDEPTCDKAQFRECAPTDCKAKWGSKEQWDCDEHTTAAVGSFPAGHYGIHEMAGNGYEWTGSWAAPNVGKCGDSCAGRDPLGPCDMSPDCASNPAKVLRGGSWYWPKDQIRSSHRRFSELETKGHRLSTRCATTRPYKAGWPPAILAKPLPEPPALQPPTAEQLAIFQDIDEDAIEEKPVCGKDVRQHWGEKLEHGGRSTTDCRDPFSYVKPNEPRGHLWRPYVTNRGGAYIGVASDQNYSYAALAKTEWLWLMDYDPVVVRLHKVLIAILEEADSPDAFVEMFTEAGQDRALEIIGKAYEADDEKDYFLAFYKAFRSKLLPYYRAERGPHKEDQGFGWLRNADHYAHIRLLAQQGRMKAIKGDMLADHSMVSVGNAAAKLGVPIRIYYTSNAPTAWGGTLTPGYRRNVRGLPMDDLSIVLQTTNSGGFKQTGYWHHNVQSGLEHQERLGRPGYRHAKQLIDDRIPADDGDLTVNGLRGE